jgi:hypothetical protein
VTKFMLVAIGAIALIPSLCNAKFIGMSKAEFEAKYGKGVKYSTLNNPWGVANWALPFYNDFNIYESNLYKSDLWSPEEKAKNPYLKYMAVWFGLGKVAGVQYWGVGADESVMRGLDECLGTHDLEEGAHFNLGGPTYHSGDWKYQVVISPGASPGLYIGTGGFVTGTLRPLYQALEAALAASQEQAKETPSPAPTPTPTPTE